MTTVNADRAHSRIALITGANRGIGRASQHTRIASKRRSRAWSATSTSRGSTCWTTRARTYSRFRPATCSSSSAPLPVLHGLAASWPTTGTDFCSLATMSRLTSKNGAASSRLHSRRACPASFASETSAVARSSGSPPPWGRAQWRYVLSLSASNPGGSPLVETPRIDVPAGALGWFPRRVLGSATRKKRSPR